MFLTCMCLLAGKDISLWWDGSSNLQSIHPVGHDPGMEDSGQAVSRGRYLSTLGVFSGPV